MGRLIDTDEYEKRIKPYDTEDAMDKALYNFAHDKLVTTPTAQPKTGRWLAKSFYEVYCDQCGFDFDIMKNEFLDKMKYCPNCGAKMKEVRNELMV